MCDAGPDGEQTGEAPFWRFVLPAHAKINLSLEVLGLRPDGYHQVRKRFQAISLHDLLMVGCAAQTSLEGGFPDDLVLRASRALEEKAGRPLPARFRLVKRIPVGAGLGGGSADAAAALRALALLHRLDVDLHEVAAGIGADVSFLVWGGAQEGNGRGECLRPIPSARGWFALAWPGYGVSTGSVYQAWDDVGGEGANQLTRAAVSVEPRLAEFAAALGKGWQMTGSGTAFFAWFPSREEAEKAAGALECWTAVVHPVGPWGEC